MTPRDGAYSADPDMCDMRGKRLRDVAYCELCGSWTNCPTQGCITSPDGRYVPLDNSPEACAARLAEMKDEEDE